jgi:hypothetical protein
MPSSILGLKMLKLLKKALINKVPLLLPLFTALILVISWYKPGLVIGGGEEGLSFAYPKRTAEIYKSDWDDSSIGKPQTTSRSRYPYFEIAGMLSDQGLPTDIIQIVTFGILFALGGIGTYLMVNKLASNRFVATAASIFYLLNPYSYANIWHRFISPLFFFYALLPMAIYFYICFLDTTKLKYLLGFIIANILLSYSFSSPATIITLWSVLSAVTLTQILSGLRKKLLVPILLFFVVFLLWTISNWWWAKDLVTTSGSFYSSVFSSDYNLGVLSSISSQYPFGVYALLRYPGVLSPTANIAAFCIFPAIVAGFVVLKDRKIKTLSGLLLAISFFVLNGTNFPTGFLFKIVFSKVYFLQLMRNPYEKFGLVLALVYSLLFAYGIYFLLRKFKKLTIFIIACLFVFLVVPMWGGYVFGSSEYNAYVKVPDDYSDVNDLLAAEKEPFRALSLPFLPGEGVHFTWPAPYFGLQPNQYLFGFSTLSRYSSEELFDSYWKALRTSLYQGKLNELIGFSNIRYLIVHKDMDAAYSGATNLEKELSFLEGGVIPSLGESVCPDYEIGKPCDVTSIGSDWEKIIFIHLTFTSDSEGSFKLTLQDSKSQYLVFNGQIDELYRIKTKEKEAIIDLRTPTERYKGLSLKDIKYLTLYLYPEGESPYQLEEIRVDKGVKQDIEVPDKIYDGDTLDVYRFNDKYFRSRIYASDEMKSVLSWNDLLYQTKIPASFIFPEHKTADVDYSYYANKLPYISFVKNSPASYSIQVKGALVPFWLIFSESNNTNWQLNGHSGFPHFVANGFTNGYFVTQLGDYDLELKYSSKK